jgi:hypothetical protein
MIALGILLPFVIAIFGWGTPFYFEGDNPLTFSIPYLSDMILCPDMSNGLFVASLILFIGIPLVMLLYLGIKVIFKLPRTHFVGVSAFSLWIISLIFILYYSFRIAKDFQYEGKFKNTHVFEMPASDTLYLGLNKNLDFNQELKFSFVDTPHNNIMFTSENEILISPELSIQANDSNCIELKEERWSMGNNPVDARNNARETDYHYSFNNNHLVFDKYMEIEEGNPFRGQEMNLSLKLPTGSIVFIDEELEEILDWWHFDYPYDMGGKYWKVTENGLDKATID